MPERIVMLSDSSAPRGGSGALALLAARLMHDAGLETIFVTGDTGEDCPLPGAIQVETVAGRPLLETPFPRRVIDGLYNQRSELLLKHILKRDTPTTVYHLHSWAQILSPSVFAALRPVSERVLISLHDFSLACPNGSYFDFPAQSVCNRVPLSAPCLTANCDKRSRVDKVFRLTRSIFLRQLANFTKTRTLFAAIHPEMTGWLVRAGLPRHNIRVLRNPVSPFRLERVPAERNGEFLFVGRVEIEKGVDLAAEASAILGRPLRVIGDGRARTELAARYSNIIWDGWRTADDISDCVQSARALMMPSRLPEPFGLVALEALQSGIPLVAFSDSFVAKEAALLGAAEIANDRTPSALAAAAQALLNDDAAERASYAGFNDCRHLSTTPNQWRDGLLALYEEMIHASRN